MGTNNTKLSGTPYSPSTNERVHAEFSNLESLLDPHFSTNENSTSAVPAAAKQVEQILLKHLLEESGAPALTVEDRRSRDEAKAAWLRPLSNVMELLRCRCPT